VEVRQAVFALNIFANQTELAEIGFVVIQIAQRTFENATFQTVASDLGSLSTIDDGLTDFSILEHRRSLDRVPFLTAERIDDLLFSSFLSGFRQAFVLSDGHFTIL